MSSGTSFPVIWLQAVATKDWEARLNFRNAVSFVFDRRFSGNKSVRRLLTYTSNAGGIADVNAG